MKKKLHIISFDVPWPANYGGVMDVYYKAAALKELGVDIVLHCFIYGREKAEKLNEVASKVYYYDRKTFTNPFSGKVPYIVASRNNKELLSNLLEDDSPILFEGLHTCFYLNSPELKDRVKIVRNHNIEHLYYKHLGRLEKNLFKKFFFLKEAERLKEYESIFNSAYKLAAISPNEHFYLSKKFHNSFWLPVFHPNNKARIKTGKGKYALYHGNLSIGENNEAALFLVKKVFNKIDFPLVIAGMNPSVELKKAVSQTKNVQLLSQVNTNEIFSLIENAHINVLPTFQSTGIKLKLLNVLFRGRFCIANNQMVKGTFLEPLCLIANTSTEFIEEIQKCSGQKLGAETIKERISILNLYYNNIVNAQKLIEELY